MTPPETCFMMLQFLSYNKLLTIFTISFCHVIFNINLTYSIYMAYICYVCGFTSLYYYLGKITLNHSKLCPKLYFAP